LRVFIFSYFCSLQPWASKEKRVQKKKKKDKALQKQEMGLENGEGFFVSEEVRLH